MSRSGYSDDYDEQFPNATALYHTSVLNAIHGKRGQKFMRELVAALDAMPEKRLIADELVQDGAVCAIGAVGLARGIDMTCVNPDDANSIGKLFGIAPRMAREIVFENDEAAGYYSSKIETPEERWQRMRDWVASNLKATVAP
jgi:hypothetical protein